MTAREELARDLGTKVPSADWDMAIEIGDSSGIADALIAEGWRKMPSREAIANALHADECPDEECDGGDMSHHDRQADTILALMDGSNDE